MGEQCVTPFHTDLHPEAMTCDLDTAVPEWVIEYPRSLPLFQNLGIDYCCGGKSLEAACRERGLDAAAVLKQLETLLDDPQEIDLQ